MAGVTCWQTGRARSFPGISGSLAGLLLVLTLVAGSPGAHEALHHHRENAPADTCAACLLLHGQVVAADVVVGVFELGPIIKVPRVFQDVDFIAVAAWLPPERGPPICALPFNPV